MCRKRRRRANRATKKGKEMKEGSNDMYGKRGRIVDCLYSAEAQRKRANDEMGDV